MLFNFRRRHRQEPFDPDQIFLDASNLPAFDDQQFEGRLERPITKPVFLSLGGFFLLVVLAFSFQSWRLQVADGAYFSGLSQANTLRRRPIFAERGVIYDRLGVELAWNDPDRHYTELSGFGHLLGYIGYPTAEEVATRDLLAEEFIGREGAERWFDESLRGQPGIKIEEINVRGEVESDYISQLPKNGQDIHLSIDAEAQAKLFELIKRYARDRGFTAGAAVIMEIESGRLAVLTSYPEYVPSALAGGREPEKIAAFIADPSKPFLNRALFGLYIPGSIIKPIIALGALTEKIVTPETRFLSTGELILPNPYFPDQPSIFRDWRAHGWVNLTKALAVSSNIYFYIVGGGFEEQVGLGVGRIEKYARLFGLGESVILEGQKTARGYVPSPSWKAAVFGDDPWRLGDTYYASIGQYGFQVTPLQMARVAAAIASRGRLVEPVLSQSRTPIFTSLPIEPSAFDEVEAGMIQSVREGTAGGLTGNLPVAAKTGTAEIGVKKDFVNSWVMGYFPTQNPRYSFAVVMERGPVQNLVGSTYAMREFFDWLALERPDWLGETPPSAEDSGVDPELEAG